MVDNVTFQDVTLATPISSTVIATDNIAGVNHQRVKIEFGVDGTATDVSATNPLPVVLTTASSFIGHVITDTTSTTIATQATAANLNATVVGTGTFPVQVTTAPVIHIIADSGTITSVTNPVTVIQATAANLNVTATLSGGSSVIGHVITDTGSTTAVTQATAANLNATVVGTGTFPVQVSAALPAGANVIGHVIADSGSTTAVTGNVTVVQPTASSLNATVIGAGTAGTANAGVVTVQGIAAMTPLLVNGSGSTQPVSGTVTVTQATAANLNANVSWTGQTVTATQATAANLNVTAALAASSTIITTQATAANLNAQVQGTVATNVAITANPLNLGAQAVSSENSAVTTARQVQLVADLVGKLIVLPYANPENFVSGAITTAIVGTTSTSLIAAPAAGLRNYITQITVSNSNATVGTDVVIQDGSGGTTLYVIPAAPAYGGATLTFPTPLRQPTTATAIFMAAVTTGAGIKVSASGYKGA